MNTGLGPDLLRIHSYRLNRVMCVSVILLVARLALLAGDYVFSGYAVYGIKTSGTEEEQVRCEFVLRTTGETWELRSDWSEDVVSSFTDDGSAQYYTVSEMPALITNQLGVVQTRPAVNAATIGNRNMISSQPELVRAILFSLTDNRLFDAGAAPFELPESLAQDVFSVEIERRTNGVGFPIRAQFRVDEQKREARIREATAKNDTKTRDYLQKGLRAGQIWASYEAEFETRAGSEFPVRGEFQVSLPSGQSHHSRYFRVVVTNTIVTPAGGQVAPPPLALNTFVQDVRLNRTYGYYASNGNWLALSEVATHGRELVRASNTGLTVRTVFLWLLGGILLFPPVIFGFIRWSKNKKKERNNMKVKAVWFLIVLTVLFSGVTAQAIMNFKKCLSVGSRDQMTCQGNAADGCTGNCYRSIILPANTVCNSCYGGYLDNCPVIAPPPTVTGTATVGKCTSGGSGSWSGTCGCDFPNPPVTMPVVITCNC